jgi:ubiquinone/menaquinone biosynthesis C-methylase UbiE
METYTHSNIKDYFQLFKKRLISSRINAGNHYLKYLKIQKEVKAMLNLELKGKIILDLGCGQRYPYTYLLSKNNVVVGIDLDVILKRHDLKNYREIISKNGLNRFFKTFLRSLFFDRRYFKNLARMSNMGKNPHPVIKHMNAENLKFKDNSFDFVLSILSFEHFKNVEKCVQEVKRVLKEDSKFYISVDLYSKLHGAHEINPKQPWNHLLNKNFKPNVYLNKLRMEEYKTIFSRHFGKIQFICKEDPDVKKHLTPELKKQLSNYSDIELTMYPLVIMGEK